ncbi:MAG: alpha/beta fold hydrolase [Deltaproteobacteria bacterium]|nr:alpha/beta fold hydrolase [Deltaproteobacteria bacterium]
MRSSYGLSLLVALLLAGCPRGNGDTTPQPEVEPPAAAPVLLGGTLILPTGDPMEVQVTLQPREGGDWDGSLFYLIKQDLVVPLDELVYDDSTFRCTAVAPGQSEEARATFEASLAGDPPWAGTLTQAGHSAEFMLVPMPARPQTPQPPFPYAARDLDFDSPDGTHLACTLTVPEGPGPHPAVILLTGSGLQNRDYALFWHKSWVVVADAFARRGLATLRCDDRAVGGSTGDPNTTTMQDMAQDAAAGAEALAAQPDIDPDRIGALGHSQGATVAALAAGRSIRIRFVVHLAGMGLPGAEILVIQEGLIFAAAGVPAEPIAALQEVHRRLHALLLDPAADPAALRDAARAVVAGQFAIAADHLGAPAHEVTDAELDHAIAVWQAPSTMDLIRFDPVPALRDVRVPFLALNGTRDLQVPCDQDLEAVEQILLEAGNPDVTIQALEGLNHAFQPAVTGNIDEYEQIATTFDPAALELIIDWIRAHTGLVD